MSSKFSTCASACALAVAAVLVVSCTQVRGRKRIQEANELYHQGKYTQAVAVFKEAEELVPELPTLWLNEGYTCRQLIAPGGHDPESQRAAACALAAFQRLEQVAPRDPRAAELTIQTWFDIQDWKDLEATFLDRHRRSATDLEAVHGLQDVYYKSGKWNDALAWSERAAALRPNDAEAQYGVGTFVWQILSSHGGGPPMAGYSPWPQSAGADSSMKLAPPASASGDVTGSARGALADQGIAYLEKALALRPRYPEAMTYLALLWRQKSFASFDDPIIWQAQVDEADDWLKRAADARGGKS